MCLDQMRCSCSSRVHRGTEAAWPPAEAAKDRRIVSGIWKSFEYRPQRSFRGGRATTLPTPLPDVSKKTCTITDAMAA